MNQIDYLLLSLPPLILGPLLYEAFKGQKAFLSILDGFIFISISGLLAAHFFEDLEIGFTLYPILAVAAGFLGPNILEKYLEKAAEAVHKASLIVGILGIVFHEALDGAGLALMSSSDLSEIHHLPIAIILHRIPVGLMIWWLLRPILSNLAIYGILALMMLATVFGWVYASASLFQLDGQFQSLLQAFIAGSILHVVFFRVHLHSSHGKVKSCCHDHRKDTASLTKVGSSPKFSIEAIGNFLGLIFLIICLRHDQHLIENLRKPVEIFYNLLAQSAPALCFAFVVAGLLYALLPNASYNWMNKGSRTSQALRGVIFGLPLPICSCGVVPFYKSLIDRGVSKTAAVAFLIATPELGIDALLLSIPLLGLDMALARLVAAFLLAFSMAMLLGKVLPHEKAKVQLSVVKTPLPLFSRLKSGLRYGLCDLVDSTGPWILLGLGVAAFLDPVLKQMPLSFGYQLDVLIFSSIGILVYVCASGATPLVAVMLAAGLSPGAALSFLLAGPATNVTTFGVLSNLHGRYFAIRFGALTAILAALMGILLNLIFSTHFQSIKNLGHDHSISLLQHFSVAVLVFLVCYAIFRKGARSFLSEIFGGEVMGDAVKHIES